MVYASTTATLAAFPNSAVITIAASPSPILLTFAFSPFGFVFFFLFLYQPHLHTVSHFHTSVIIFSRKLYFDSSPYFWRVSSFTHSCQFISLTFILSNRVGHLIQIKMLFSTHLPHLTFMTLMVMCVWCYSSSWSIEWNLLLWPGLPVVPLLLTPVLSQYFWHLHLPHLLSRRTIVPTRRVYFTAIFVSVLHKLQHTLVGTRSPHMVAVCSAYHVYPTDYCQPAVKNLSINIDGVPVFTFEHHFQFISCIHTLANSTSTFPSAAIDPLVEFHHDFPV